ncbi:MAG: ANTAR domain-containing protein [Clostridiaceae bacterium]|nr:ANTAR domain-containing protein [Clostridiaceae bacterium]HPU45090.1 ANTAR domain-containing protein [Thermoclostridium sp.]
MDSALIVSYSEKTADSLAQILAEASVSRITTLSNAAQARRALIDNDFDLCIVNAPLPDESGESFARYVAETGVCEVILMVKAEHYDEVASRVEDCGVVTISKPVNKAMLWNAIKLTAAIHNKVKAIHNENKKLIQKIEDIRIIDRAKCLLISQLSLSEPEAHRYIEKQAMDMRMTRRQVAEAILKIYEN